MLSFRAMDNLPWTYCPRRSHRCFANRPTPQERDGGCAQAKDNWTCGDSSRGPTETLSGRGYPTLACGASRKRSDYPRTQRLNFPEPSLLAWPRRTPLDPYFGNSVTAPNGRAGNITNYSPAMIVTWKCPTLSRQSCLDEKPLLPLISLGIPSTQAT